MDLISARDRGILRERAKLQLGHARSSRNDLILRKWRAQAAGRRDSPPVRMLFYNFRHEVITPRLRCEGAQARGIEAAILGNLVGRELFDDDTPVPPTFDMGWQTRVQPFGLTPDTRAGGATQGFHIGARSHGDGDRGLRTVL